MSDPLITTENAPPPLTERDLAKTTMADNIRYLARQARVDDEHIDAAQLDALKVAKLADKHRNARGMLSSRTDWRDSNLIVAAVGGALTAIGGVAELTSGPAAALWHNSLALMWPLMPWPTLLAAGIAGCCQVGRVIHHGEVMGINRRTRRWAKATPI